MLTPQQLNAAHQQYGSQIGTAGGAQQEQASPGNTWATYDSKFSTSKSAAEKAAPVEKEPIAPLTDRITEDIGGRVKGIGEAAKNAVENKANPITNAGQVVSNVLGTATDVAGELGKSAWHALVPAEWQKKFSDTMNAAADSDFFKKAGETWNEFATQHPEIAQNAKSAADIVGFMGTALAPGQIAKGIKTAATGAAEKAAGIETGEIGVTPFRGTPVSTVAETEPYYSTPRAALFEKSLAQGEKYGITAKVNRAAGSWEGKIEPSFSVDFKGKAADVLKYAAEHGTKGNQDAVIKFVPKTGATGFKYELSGLSDADTALKELHANGVSGATIKGKNLAVYSMDGSELPAVQKTASKLGAKINTTPGEVSLFTKGKDYAAFGKELPKVEPVAAPETPATPPSKLASLVQPVMDKSEKARAILKGQGKEPGILKPSEIAPSEEDIRLSQRISNSPYFTGVQPIAENRSLLQNVKTINDEIGNVATKRIVPFLDNFKQGFNQKQILTKIRRVIGQKPLVFVSETAEGNTYKKVVETALKEIKKYPNNASGLWKARIGFDQAVRETFGDAIWDKSTPLRKAIGNVRDAMNDAIGDLTGNPTQWKEYRSYVADLYKAAETIADKAAAEVGTSKVSAFMKKHPLLRSALRAGAYGLGHGEAYHIAGEAFH